MRVMATGFEPFGGDKINPSWEAVRALPDRIGAAEIVKCQIPTAFEAAERIIRKRLDQVRFVRKGPTPIVRRFPREKSWRP